MRVAGVGRRCVDTTAERDARTAVVREGATLAVGRDVDAPAERTATALRDTQRWPEWSPSVRGVESTDRYVETGTTGRVRVACRWVPFRVTAATRLRWDWRVAGVPATGHRIDRYPGESVGVERLSRSRWSRPRTSPSVGGRSTDSRRSSKEPSESGDGAG